jgi:hypothetical protein
MAAVRAKHANIVRVSFPRHFLIKKRSKFKNFRRTLRLFLRFLKWQPNNFPLVRRNCNATIDISWVDCPYTASTCDVMCSRQRRQLYYAVVKFLNTIWPPPPPAVLPSYRYRRAALTTDSNGTQLAHKGKGGGLDNLLVSMNAMRLRPLYSTYGNVNSVPNVYR